MTLGRSARGARLSAFELVCTGAGFLATSVIPIASAALPGRGGVPFSGVALGIAFMTLYSGLLVLPFAVVAQFVRFRNAPAFGKATFWVAVVMVLLSIYDIGTSVDLRSFSLVSDFWIPAYSGYAVLANLVLAPLTVMLCFVGQMRNSAAMVKAANILLCIWIFGFALPIPGELP
jgi:hypothetical protein